MARVGLRDFSPQDTSCGGHQGTWPLSFPSGQREGGHQWRCRASGRTSGQLKHVSCFLPDREQAEGQGGSSLPPFHGSECGRTPK